MPEEWDDEWEIGACQDEERIPHVLGEGAAGDALPYAVCRAEIADPIVQGGVRGVLNQVGAVAHLDAVHLRGLEDQRHDGEAPAAVLRHNTLLEVGARPRHRNLEYVHPARVVIAENVTGLDVEVCPLGRKGLGKARAVGDRLLRAHGPSHHWNDDRAHRHARAGDGEAVEAAVRRCEEDGVRGLLRGAGVGGVADAPHWHLRLEGKLSLHGGVGCVGAHALAAAGEAEGLDLEGGHGRDHALVVCAVVCGGVEELVRGLHHELRRLHRLRDLVVARASAVNLLVETVAAGRYSGVGQTLCRRQQDLGEPAEAQKDDLHAGYPALFELHGMRKDTIVSTK